MFEIVKMTQVCQYWRSTLISYPHLWSTIFVQKLHKDFVVACLKRSQGVPLTVCLRLTSGNLHPSDIAMFEVVRASSGLRIDEKNPSHRRTSLDPLLEVDHIRRIRKLDVHLSMLNDDDLRDSGRNIKDALGGVEFFTSPLPALESFSFYADQLYPIKSHPKLPEDIFSWESLPPTKLRHLALHGCIHRPTPSIRNLTSFELSGSRYAAYSVKLDQNTFLPFISASPSLVSLSLAHCTFPDREGLSEVTPVTLTELRSLRLIWACELPSFPSLIDVPAFKTLSSLRVQETGFRDFHFLVRAESDDGFQLLYDAPNHQEAVSDWLGLTDRADPNLAFVRFEGRDLGSMRGQARGVSLLPLFVNAEVLEIGASFTEVLYDGFWRELGFWEDLEKAGPQLTTLRLEITESISRRVGRFVEELVEARLHKGVPLAKLERMVFEEMSEEGEEKAKERWEGFRAGLNIDKYLATQ